METKTPEDLQKLATELEKAAGLLKEKARTLTARQEAKKFDYLFEKGGIFSSEDFPHSFNWLLTLTALSTEVVTTKSIGENVILSAFPSDDALRAKACKCFQALIANSNVGIVSQRFKEIWGVRYKYLYPTGTIRVGGSMKDKVDFISKTGLKFEVNGGGFQPHYGEITAKEASLRDELKTLRDHKLSIVWLARRAGVESLSSEQIED